jgi:hypothetical protein
MFKELSGFVDHMSEPKPVPLPVNGQYPIGIVVNIQCNQFGTSQPTPVQNSEHCSIPYTCRSFILLANPKEFYQFVQAQNPSGLRVISSNLLEVHGRGIIGMAHQLKPPAFLQHSPKSTEMVIGCMQGKSLGNLLTDLDCVGVLQGCPIEFVRINRLTCGNPTDVL